MPRGDRTGPTGAGPMTGRGMGVCADSNAPGVAVGGGFGRGMGKGGGFGRGMGMGMGRGFRNRCFAGWGPAPQAPVAPVNRTDQIAALKEQRDHIQQQLEMLEEK